MKNMQTVKLNNLDKGLIVEHNGEKYKISGEGWKIVFDSILKTIIRFKSDEREKDQEDKNIIDEYEKQLKE